MKLSESEIQERQAAAQQRAKKIDELRLSVLKGHLLMEEALDGFIQAAVCHPEQINHVNMNFHTKAHLAIALGCERDKDEMWSVVWAINQLRNKIAHKLDSDEIDAKVKFLRSTYVAALEPVPAEHAKTQAEKDMIDSACAVCVGFLGQLTSEAKTRRMLIDENWEGPG